MPSTQTRRPTGAGDYYGEWFDPYYYTYVDDVTPDDNASYVAKAYDGYTKTEGYTFPAFDIPAGSTGITLRVTYRMLGGTAWGCIKVNGYHYQGTGHNTGSWSTYYNDHSVNPATSSAWTVDDINGVGSYPLQQMSIKMDASYQDPTKVTQIYLTVTFTPPPGVGYAAGGCCSGGVYTYGQAHNVGM